jgi:hypothetical protein
MHPLIAALEKNNIRYLTRSAFFSRPEHPIPKVLVQLGRGFAPQDVSSHRLYQVPPVTRTWILPLSVFYHDDIQIST